jgi:hypothetical protein
MVYDSIGLVLEIPHPHKHKKQSLVIAILKEPVGKLSYLLLTVKATETTAVTVTTAGTSATSTRHALVAAAEAGKAAPARVWLGGLLGGIDGVQYVQRHLDLWQLLSG